MQTIQSNRQVKQWPGENKYCYWEEAFDRNIGFLTAGEQERLHHATVAIPGLGGAGGSHVATMARLGVGRLHLADFDRFDPVNINRQHGARVSTFGRRKSRVLAEEARAINPFVELKVFDEGVTEENMDAFLDGVDVVIDGMDFFNIEMRRKIFKRAWDKHIHVITAGPMGFGSAFMVFAPDRGMTFDRYFDLYDEMSMDEKLIAFFVGLAPKAAQKNYTVPGSISMADRRGPSLGSGCQLCAAVAAAEAVRILLGKPGLRPAPHYFQFDPFARRFIQGRLWFGNRGPLQRFKRRILKSKLGTRSDFLQEARPKADGRRWPDDNAPDGQMHAFLMQAAIRAPSGDNCQPWQYLRQDNKIHFMVDPSVDRSFFNVSQVASLISCGAAIENLVLAASRFDRGARVEIVGTDAAPHVSIELSDKKVAEDPLQRFVWERHTNRTMYDRSPLDPDDGLKIRSSIKAFPDAKLLLLTEPDQIEEAGRLVARIDRIRAEHQGLHKHLMRMIRFTTQEAMEKRDGFSLKNLEAGTAGEWFLRLTRPWPVMNALNHIGMGKMVSKITYQGIRSSSAVGLLKVPSWRPADMITGGRALERIWLTVASLGLAFQPMTAATLFWLRWQMGGQDDFSPVHRKLLTEVWPHYRRLLGVQSESEGHVMLFRVGRGRPVSCRTLRKPVDAFRLPLPDGVWRSGEGKEEAPLPMRKAG